MRVLLIILLNLSLLITQTARADNNNGEQLKKTAVLTISCSLSLTQSWFELPEGSTSLMDMKSKIIQYDTKDIDFVITSEGDKEVLSENDPRWTLLEQRSVADSPNLNNFRVLIKKSVLNEKPHLTIDLLVVHRHLKHNLITRTSYPISSSAQAIPIFSEHIFGPGRLSTGIAQQSMDDFQEGSFFSAENPGITLSGECSVQTESKTANTQ